MNISEIKDLQDKLRQLGYLEEGIDGDCGPVTKLAIKSLKYDLLNNIGESNKNDWASAVKVIDYNKGRVTDVDDNIDEEFLACINDMTIDPDFPKLPKSGNPFQDNLEVLETIDNIKSSLVPIPFLVGILKQESNLKHFYEPEVGDDDFYILVGMDRNATKDYIITSRGYGVGQYTLFHHPPTQKEIEDFILDIEKNIIKATKVLKDKFNNFINGKSSGFKADDRQAEQGNKPLVICKYTDERYMKDCKNCMISAGTCDIYSRYTPVFEGSKLTFSPTEYYHKTIYTNVPVRKNIGCDWPYAVRRYNGAGINSYHYQTIVLKNVLEGGSI